MRRATDSRLKAAVECGDDLAPCLEALNGDVEAGEANAGEAAANHGDYILKRRTGLGTDDPDVAWIAWQHLLPCFVE